jgi:beta-N-acetylhexosaminidase
MKKNQELREKIGQMVMVGFRGTVAGPDSRIIHDIREYGLGGVWLVDNDSPMGRTLGNVESAEQLKTLTDSLQQAAKIPLFIAIDAEGGQVIRLKENYGFPPTRSARYLGQLDDPSVTAAQARQIVESLLQTGINFNFAPVLDLDKNPDGPALGRKERCFSADPETVIRHAEIILRIQREAGLLSCCKHFPGHGSARIDSHLDTVDVTETWGEEELEPFRRLIEMGLIDALVTAHIHNRRWDAQYPATLSKNLLTGMLRRQQGFEGVVFSDDMNMGAIRNHYEMSTAIELALNAGVDVILMSNVGHYDDHITEKTTGMIRRLVEEGRIGEDRIEESYGRIRKAKARLKTAAR